MGKIYFGLFLVVYLLFGVSVLITGLLFLTPAHPEIVNYEEEVQESIEKMDKTFYVEFITKWLFIIYGIVIIFAVICGGYALISQNIALLKSYRGTLIAVLGSKLGISIALLVSVITNKFGRKRRKIIMEHFKLIPLVNATLTAQIFLEKTYDCCGVDNYTNYNTIYKEEVVNYPETCCVENITICTIHDNIKSDGCFDKLLSALNYSYIPLLVVSFLGCIIEGLGERAIKMLINQMEESDRSALENNIPLNPSTSEVPLK